MKKIQFSIDVSKIETYNKDCKLRLSKQGGEAMTYSLNLRLIKEKRLERHLTLEEMAHSLGLSSKSDYFKRETGDTKFKSTELPILSKKLNIPFDNFFNSNVEKIETR